MGVGSVADVADQTVTVEGVHDLRKGQICRNLLRNTELVQLNVRIRRNDRASREVHALSHQVTAHTTRLSSEARLQSTKRTTRALSGRSETLDVVVHIGRHIVLNHRSVLIDHLRVLTLVELVAKTLVVAKNVNELVREIVLHALVIVHHNRRANCKRRNRQHSADHPLRSREGVIESKLVASGIRHTLEGAQNHLHLNRNRRRGLIGVADRESLQSCSLARNTRDLAKEGRLACAALARLLKSLRADLRNDLAGILEALDALRRQLPDQLRRIREDDVRAVQADDVAQLLDPVEELVEIHRPSKCDVTEVSGAELVGVFAGGTDLAVLNDSEAGIKDAIRHRLSRLIGFVGGNLHDAPLENVVGVCDAELNSGDCVAHFTSYTVLCKVFVLGTKASVAVQKASSWTTCSTI